VLFVVQDLSYEPQGLMWLSSVLKAGGHQVALAAADHEDPVAFAASWDPDILGYSVMTGSQRAYLELNRSIRAAINPQRRGQGERQVFSAFGGPHPTFFPEIVEEEGVDGVCIGEGEGAIVDLADALGAGGPIPASPIPNWWLKSDGEIIKADPRPLIRELSSLPPPDRALVYEKSRALAGGAITHFISSRGCPYACTYCFNHAYYQVYRRERRGQQRRVDEVIEEVNAVRSRWPLKQAVFLDDLFIVDTEWLEELAEKWPSMVGIPFFCNARANLLVKDPRRVELLRKAGCSTVSMGFETANDRIRTELLKRRMSREEMIEAGRMVRGAGMHLTSTNILGLPTSTLDDDLATMRLSAEARVSYAFSLLFQPYPGTELGRFVQDRELTSATLDDIGEIAWDHTVLHLNGEADRRARERLQRLFAIGVEWPNLEPFIRWLTKLPDWRVIDACLWWVHKLHKGVAIYTRVHRHQAGPLELLRDALHFLKLKS
jgi:radical SAM superfamily enzyme YgiQ (UPF0313 family)